MRRSAVLAVAIVLVAGACSGGTSSGGAAGSGGGETGEAAATTIAPTTAPSTTTSTSTTSTTLSQEQLDASAAASLWDGLDSAWEEGPEAAARYIEDHTYPGFPAAYEDCLVPGVSPGAMSYAAHPETLESDPGWASSEVDVEVLGRIYTIDVDIRSGIGAEAETRTLHVSILDGEPHFFFRCEPRLSDDALAYRFEEGDTFRHEVSYRADITEDQTPVGGRVRTGRETWTQERSFVVEEAEDGGPASIEMTYERVTWEMFTGGVHYNAFDTDRDPEDRWYGDQGDLALKTRGWKLQPAGPASINSELFPSFLPLPAEEVGTGSSWEGRWSLGDPRLAGPMTITVTGAGEETVEVAFEGTGSGTRTISDPIKLDLSFDTEATMSGTAVIESGTGWVRSMTVEIDAEGTIEVTSGGFYQNIRPLAPFLDEVPLGSPIPATYEIRMETVTVGG
jgi:hypothetical protein